MSITLLTKTLSALDNCFLDEDINTKREVSHFSALRGGRVAFQLALFIGEAQKHPILAKVSLSGLGAPYASVREVVCVPNHYPVNTLNNDGNYLRTTPGLYPDLIRPLHYDGHITIPSNQLRTLWIELEFPFDAPVCNYPLTVTISKYRSDETLAETSVEVKLLDITLPKQRLIHTEWLYTDCIAHAHGVSVFSEEHWAITENYIKTAVRSGINMILTPVFTPELDTYIGGERLTTQLIGITVTGDNEYAFDTQNLERWIDMCLGAGVEYFEIPHFFTQWGAEHAPKFMAYVNGEYKRIFGWETDSQSDEYKIFLSRLIPTIIETFKKRGLDKKCYFHVSDEPSLSQLEQYKRCKDMIAPYLDGYHVIDALSDYEFYKLGVLQKPVPAIKHIKPFLDGQVHGLWAYYCGASGAVNVTNRFISMPLSRIRILGVQLYMARIEGFLHWGYNFYNNRYSYDAINPFLNTDGEGFAPSGDTFLVYPGTNGEVWESLRLCALREAMEDIRALELCEEKRGREFTESLVLRVAGGALDFFDYPISAEFFERMRAEIYTALEA